MVTLCKGATAVPIKDVNSDLNNSLINKGEMTHERIKRAYLKALPVGNFYIV